VSITLYCSVMTDSVIHELDAATINQIQAGEVITHPAAVVKELVENSLDADATRIRAVVEEAGTERIRVVDDGVGMSEQDLEKAVQKHTTSKIADFGELESSLATLGFRGEALSSIGEVSRLTIRTKSEGGSRGTELYLEGGTIESIEPAGCPEGTDVEVSDLVYNMPVRKNSLSALSTEFSKINDVVSAYALANPDVAFTLEHNDRETFTTTGQGNLQATTLAVYGREVAEAMLTIPASVVPEGPLDALDGLVSHPETNRASPDYVRVYVNGRAVDSKTIRDAVVEAYNKQLEAGRFPFTVLFCELSVTDVDVNVHPRKQEIQFADEQAIHDQVEQAVTDTLLDHGLLRSSAPRGESAPEQATIDPGQQPRHGSGPADGTDTPPSSGESERATTDTKTPGEGSEKSTATDSGSVADPPDPTAGNSVSGTTGTTHNGENTSQDDTTSSPEDGSSSESIDSSTGSRTETTDHPDSTMVEGDSQHSATDTEPERGATDDAPHFTAPADQATLAGDTTVAKLDREFDNLPSLRVLGQFRDTYLIAESPDGLVLIDQHAADERVNYERLREEFDEGVTSQSLASSVDLDLPAGEAALFENEACEQALDQLGFTAARTGATTVEIESVPGNISATDAPELLQNALTAFANGEQATKTVSDARNKVIADLACYPSLTGNTSITKGSIIELLESLEDCTNPYACPHGRPIVIELPDSDIEARFERDYPGHPD
jgi:DNA mismatch repair protein MutL